MRRRPKIVFLFLCLVVPAVWLSCFWPAATPVAIALANGTRLDLVGTDAGPLQIIGGSPWRRAVLKLASKTFGHNTEKQAAKFAKAIYPHSGDYPFIHSSVFTNGIGLAFRRHQDGRPLPPSDVFNNSGGALVVVDQNGDERAAALRSVVWETQKDKAVAESLLWEIPMTREKELCLRIYETNEASQKVFVHNFRLPNPAR